MKVCLVTGEYPPMRGGVADYTAFLAAALSHYDVATVVVTSEKARVRHSDAPTNGFRAEVHTVPTWGFSSLRKVLDVVEATRPDVVHIQYQTGAFEMHPAINLLPLRLRLLRERPRVAVTFHDLKVPYVFPKAGPIRHLANTALVDGADGVVTTNAEDTGRVSRLQKSPSGLNGFADRAGRFGPPLYRVPIGSNIPVAPPSSFDRAQWRARLGVGPDQLLLSYFGFLVPTKGVDVLMSALEELGRRGRNVKLAMVGGSAADLSVTSDRSYEHQILNRTDAPSLRGSVLWTGFAAREEVSANLLASDVCVLPFREGASLRHGTLIAAIAHGLPIITTQPPKGPSFLPGVELRSGENCLLVPPGDVDALVAAIEALGCSAEQRMRLASGASKLAESFHWDAIARQTIRMYQQMLS